MTSIELKVFSGAISILMIVGMFFSAIPVEAKSRITYTKEIFVQTPQIPIGIFGILFDKDGNLFVAHESSNGNPGHEILKITPEGVVTIFATGFLNPAGMAFDKKGNLWVCDEPGAFEKLNPDGTINAKYDFFPQLVNPNAIAFDRKGNLYLCAENDHSWAGIIYKCAPPYTGIVKIAEGFNNPNSIAVDDNGDIYTSDMTGTIFKITEKHGAYTTSVFSSDLGWTNGGLVLGEEGNVYACSYQVKVFSRNGGAGTIIAEGFDDIPRSLAFNKNGDLFVSVGDLHGEIWKITEIKCKFPCC